MERRQPTDPRTDGTADKAVGRFYAELFPPPSLAERVTGWLIVALLLVGGVWFAVIAKGN